MADGQPPYYDIPFLKAIFLIPVRPPPKLTNPDAWSPEFNSFIAACLQKKPQDRPTALDLLKHPFLLRESAVKSNTALESLIQESNEIIKSLGSRKVALGDSDSQSVSRAANSSTTTSSSSDKTTDTTKFSLAEYQPEPSGTTDFKVERNKEMNFVPQYLLKSLPSEQDLSSLDKKLQMDLESLRREYERQSSSVIDLIEERES